MCKPLHPVSTAPPLAECRPPPSAAVPRGLGRPPQRNNNNNDNNNNNNNIVIM